MGTRLRILGLAGVMFGASLLPCVANTITVKGTLGVNPTSTTSAPILVNPLATGVLQDAWLFSLVGGPFFVTTGVASSTAADLASFITGFQVSVWSFGADNLAGTADDTLALGPGVGGPLTVPGSQFAQVSGVLSPGLYYFEVQGTGGSEASYNGSVDTRAVPGPIVGAGLPGLILALGGLIALARRRKAAYV